MDDRLPHHSWRNEFHLFLQAVLDDDFRSCAAVCFVQASSTPKGKLELAKWECEAAAMVIDDDDDAGDAGDGDDHDDHDYLKDNDDKTKTRTKQKNTT